jgi:hypothetical protein
VTSQNAEAPAATPAPIRRRSPRYTRVPGAVTIRLTEDDLRILRAVHSHRFLRSTHIERLLPWRSSKHLQYRLFGLFHNGYLDRMREDAPAGENPPMVYALGNRGAEALDLRRSGVDWSEKNRSYGSRQLKHALLVSEIRVAIRWSCVSNQIRFIPPEEIIESAPQDTRQLQRPFQWRISVNRPGMTTARETVRPDLIFGLEFPKHPTRPAHSRVRVHRRRPIGVRPVPRPRMKGE